MTLAQLVRDQRYAKGWGPDELAHRASISRTALYQIESGKTEHPRAGTLRRIAQALEIPTESLLGPHLGVIEGPWTAADYPAARRDQPAPLHSADDPAAIRFRVGDARLRDADLDRKVRAILASPLGDSLVRIIEESYRILPTLPSNASLN